MREVKTYLIESQMAAVKIGISSDVEARMKNCQTGNPDRLRLVGILFGNREPELHAKFQSHRIHGEWFHASPVLTWWESEGRMTPTKRRRRQAGSVYEACGRFYVRYRKAGRQVSQYLCDRDEVHTSKSCPAVLAKRDECMRQIQ
jgi:hypothetical protein